VVDDDGDAEVDDDVAAVNDDVVAVDDDVTDDNDQNYLAPNVHLQMSLTHRECDPPRPGDVHEMVSADQIQGNW
jgi:hypothetical protein